MLKNIRYLPRNVKLNFSIVSYFIIIIRVLQILFKDVYHYVILISMLEEEREYG